MFSLLSSVLLLSAVPTAQAWDPHHDAPGDLELSLESGWIRNADPRFELFGEGSMPSTGLRFAIKVHPRIALLTTLGAGQVSAEVGAGEGGDTYYDSYYYCYDDCDGETLSPGYGFYTRMRSAELTLGLKADLPVAAWFHPYLALSGIGSLAATQLDDDLEHDDNANQIRALGFTGGGVAMAGADFRIPVGETGVAIVPFLEMGYSLQAPLKLGALGELPMRGFSGNLGIGARW